MVSLEMIGYFRDEPKSQDYPVAGLGLMYPDQGNFIAIVGAFNDVSNMRRIKALFKGASDLPVESINAPSSVPGVDFSDHASYWRFDMPAVMVTDTAFLRNPNYHEAGDTPDDARLCAHGEGGARHARRCDAVLRPTCDAGTTKPAAVLAPHCPCWRCSARQAMTRCWRKCARIRPLFTPKPPPQPGDWLAEHKEPGQSYSQFREAPRRRARWTRSTPFASCRSAR